MAMAFDKSQFLAGAIVEREVTMPDGSVATLHFAKPSAADVRRWHRSETVGGDEAFFGMQRLIAASLYDPSVKKPVFVGDEYKGITYEGCEVLLPHVLEVAGVGHSEKKPSPSADMSGSATS